jgi:hypothetical protein
VADNKGGHPLGFKDEFIEEAERLCGVMGATDEKLATWFKVVESTINNWKIKYPGFLSAIKRGKDKYDCENAEVSLLKRVSGFEYTEKHTEAILDKSGNPTELLKVKNVTKHYPPQTNAIIFWLCNRNKDRWKNLSSIEVGGLPGGAPIDSKVTIYIPENGRGGLNGNGNPKPEEKTE